MTTVSHRTVEVTLHPEGTRRCGEVFLLIQQRPGGGAEPPLCSWSTACAYQAHYCWLTLTLPFSTHRLTTPSPRKSPCQLGYWHVVAYLAFRGGYWFIVPNTQDSGIICHSIALERSNSAHVSRAPGSSPGFVFMAVTNQVLSEYQGSVAPDQCFRTQWSYITSTGRYSLQRNCQSFL